MVTNKSISIIAKGFDRDLDFEDIKTKLLNTFDIIIHKRNPKHIDFNQLVYITISLIQLRNGSRISEAINAFKLFMTDQSNDKVIVKIAKSESLKYNKTGEKIHTKPRFRKIMFPNKWITFDIMLNFYKVDPNLLDIDNDVLRKRILKYLLDHFKCNTHSLRYAFINYMLYIEKRPMTDVAKFVGHVNVSQLVRYTQLKNSDQIFDLDI